MNIRLLAALALTAVTVPAHAAPALWEVRDEDSAIWLFGSINNLPASVTWRTPLFDELLARADKVVFDSDVRSATADMARQVYLSRGTYSDGTLLTDLLDEDTEARFREAATATSAPIEFFLTMRPWFAVNALYIGTQVAYGVSDESLALRLQPELADERLIFLEAAEESFDLIEDSSIEEQLAMLETTLDELANIPKVAEKLLDNWSAGTPENAEIGFALDFSGFSGNFVTRVIAKRNSAWTPRIEAMLQDDEENLVIVDTANILGSGGLLDRLGEASYTIKRVQ
jgi:uncharacterized protein YbaP (TraB family)